MCSSAPMWRWSTPSEPISSVPIKRYSPTTGNRALPLAIGAGVETRLVVRWRSSISARHAGRPVRGHSGDRGSAQVPRHRRAGLRESLHGIGLDVLDREHQHVVTCIVCLGDELVEEVLRTAVDDLALALGARPVPDTPMRRLAVRDLLSRIRIGTEVFDRRIGLQSRRGRPEREGKKTPGNSCGLALRLLVRVSDLCHSGRWSRCAQVTRRRNFYRQFLCAKTLHAGTDGLRGSCCRGRTGWPGESGSYHSR